MLKVLIVDDDQRIINTMRDIITIKGFEAATASSGEEAIELLKTEKPQGGSPKIDCVLLDNQMGGMSGAQTYSIIKEICPNLPVIFMTAYSTDEIVKACKEDGAYAALSKPINIQMLLSFLNSLRKTVTIIVIDDNKEFCTILRDVLALKKYDVECMVSPIDLSKTIEKHKSNAIILLDLKLGELNGIDVLKDIKKTYSNIPIVLITGYHAEMLNEIEEGLLLNAYTCLYKPIEIEGLYKILIEIQQKKLKEILGVPFNK